MKPACPSSCPTSAFQILFKPSFYSDVSRVFWSFLDCSRCIGHSTSYDHPEDACTAKFVLRATLPDGSDLIPESEHEIIVGDGNMTLPPVIEEILMKMGKDVKATAYVPAEYVPTSKIYRSFRLFLQLISRLFR